MIQEIRVYKSKRLLEVFKGDQKVFECQAGLGRDPGAKLREGDYKTPEGEYEVLVKNPQSKHYLSLGISYPNKNDAKRGLEAGLINQEIFKEICTMLDEGRGTLWNTPLGGKIYIHGDLEQSNGSQGCVCLNRGDIKKLFEMVQVGDKVSIFP